MANFWSDLSQICPVTGSNISLTCATGGLTATSNGTGVDTIAQVSDSLACVVICGVVSGTTPTLDIKVQDSADNTTFADVTGATFTQITASTKMQIIYVPPCRRYVRTVQTVAGTSPVFNAVTAFLFPVSTTPTATGGFNQTSAAANG